MAGIGGAVSPAAGRPGPGGPNSGAGAYSSAPTGRTVLDAGEPYPPLSGRATNGIGISPMEQKRISPRSPRAALEPEQVMEI
jgi:hypothetical protein